MAQEFKPGQIVLESGIYRLTLDTQHPEVPHLAEEEMTSAPAGTPATCCGLASSKAPVSLSRMRRKLPLPTKL
jgi:hypothetical protein